MNDALKCVYKSVICVCLWAVFLGVTVTASADSLQEVFESGVVAYQQGKYQEAKTLFSQAIEMNSNFAPSFYYIGLIQKDIEGDELGAIWFFKTALQIDPQFFDAQSGLCRAYYQMQEYDRAEDACLKALDISPNAGNIELTLAWVYLVGKSQPHKAQYYFEKVYDIVKNPIVDFGLGMAYAMTDNHPRVLDMVTRLRAQGEDGFAAHLEAILRSKVPREQLIPQALIDQMEKTRREKVLAEMEEEAEAQKAIAQQQESLMPSSPGNVKVRIQGKIPVPQITGMQGTMMPAVSATEEESTHRHPGSLSE